VAEASSGHEAADIDVRRIVGVGAIVAAAVILIIAGIRSAMVHWITAEHAALVARPGSIPPVPRLQPDPGSDLEAFRAEKHALLSEWKWTDSSHTFARIPIERAMSLYVQGARAASQHPQEHEP
jgi:hypothetical protein